MLPIVRASATVAETIDYAVTDTVLGEFLLSTNGPVYGAPLAGEIKMPAGTARANLYFFDMVLSTS